MILPLVEYGDIYISSATKGNRKKLQILQNKALRCALQKYSQFNSNELHKEAKLSKLKTRRKIHLLLHMFQISQMPNFKGWRKKIRINTRGNTKKLMKTKKPTFTKFQNSITHMGLILWNALPLEVQQVQDYSQFKVKIKLLFNHIEDRITAP